MEDLYLLMYHGEDVKPIVVTTKDQITREIMKDMATWAYVGEDVELKHLDPDEDGCVLVEVYMNGNIHDMFTYRSIKVNTN